jgi:hypothetical protein
MKEAWKPSPVVMRSLDLIAGKISLTCKCLSFLSHVEADNVVSSSYVVLKVSPIENGLLEHMYALLQILLFILIQY